MRVVFSIALREMRSYFNSPIAYVVLGVFLLLLGYLFASTLFLIASASMRNFFAIAPVLLVIFCPAISMRLIAEEKKIGTIEHLLTFPVRDEQVVLGKFFGALGIVVMGLLFTLPYPLVLSALVAEGFEFDFGVCLGGYVGLVFLSGAFLSLGLFASALTKNQIIAFILGLLFCIFFFLVDKFALFFPAQFAEVLEYLSVDYHFNNIARGVIDTRDVVFDLSLICLALILTILSLRKLRV